MTTIIMIFILPIGIVIYFWDKKNYQEALELFENYILNVKHSGLSENEMIKKFKRCFIKMITKSYITTKSILLPKKNISISEHC